MIGEQVAIDCRQPATVPIGEMVGSGSFLYMVFRRQSRKTFDGDFG